jgi:hypothetical protein
VPQLGVDGADSGLCPWWRLILAVINIRVLFSLLTSTNHWQSAF